MNDDENNPQPKPQPWTDPTLEARVVALVLGETSAFEAAELERLLADNPEFALFKRRIEAAHSLVGVAARPENPKIQLSPERRKKLLETIGIPSVVPDKKIRVVTPRRPAWWSPYILLRIAACLVMATMVLAVCSFVAVFRNPKESSDLIAADGVRGPIPSWFSGSLESKISRPASPQRVEDIVLGSTLLADVGSQKPAAYDLAGNNTYSGGAVVSTGVVTNVQPDFSNESKKVAVSNQVPENIPPAAAAPTRRRSVSSWDDDTPQLAQAITAYETEYGRLPSGQANGGTGEFVVSRKAGDASIQLPSNLPEPASTPQAETLAFAEGKAIATAEKEIADKSQLFAMARQQPADSDKTRPSPQSAPQEERREAQDRLANEKLKTEVALKKSETGIVGSYLSGAPETAPAPSANPSNGWDSLYMFRGVNVIGGRQDETKPLPPEVVDQITAGQVTAEAPVTAGNRTAAISANAVDALLFGSPVEVAQNKDQKGANIRKNLETEGSAQLVAQANKEAVPVLGDIPMAGRVFQPESRTETPPSPQAANIINQPVFSTRDGGKVEFDGFVNYGSPINVVPSEERKQAQASQLAEEGKSLFESGRYDLASKRFEQTLEIDPSNTAARAGMAVVDAARGQYAKSASNESRRDMLRSVDKSWELPVRRFDFGNTTIVEQPQLEQRGTAIINRKLDEIIIPRIDFQDATVREAIDFLKQRASTLDGSETDSAKKGVNIVLNLPENAAESEARITLGLTDIPLRAAIDYVAKAANLKLKVEPYAVSVVPQSTSTDVLVTKEYKVPPGFIPLVPKSDATPVLGASATTSAASLSGVSARSGAREHLESLGMTFPPGATAYLIASSNKLIVKNTQTNLDLIETVVESSLAMPSTRPQATETLTAKKPDSTFSLHVSDVSFQLARDALAKGTMPEPDRIRPEEFYNAFDYNDPAPAPGEPVAARIEQSAHPFLQQRNLVRIAVKAAASGRAAGQPLRLTILLDTSGSMEREDRAVSVRQALQTLTTLLGANDRVTLIGFARTPRLLAEQVPGDQAGKIVEAADRTPSEGGTNLEEALALASEMALKQKLPAAQNRIVLLTDGAANLGNADPVRLAAQIEKTRQQGISFDACGVGAIGLNDAILETLTRKGDGRYYFLNKPEDADASFAKQLAGAFRPAAENVKVQVVFNPARVAKYRLIGFEEHLLKKEDFRNDKVQAAELSAEEAGVALYQVEPLPEGEGDLGEVFVRFRDPATDAMVERSWTMPYEAQVRAFDQASPSLQLAATAALLAEKLRGDSQVDLDALKPIVTNLRSHYPHQARVRELLLMFDQVRR